MNYGPNKKFIAICAGTGCRGYGCFKVKEELEAEIKKQNMDVDVLATGCLGFCEKGPMVVIHPDKYFYQSVKVTDVAGNSFQNGGAKGKLSAGCSTAIRS